MNKRDHTFDLAKGFAIILMVIGHCYHAEYGILHLINAFHMPFFFLVSGMLYADKWCDEVRFSLLGTGRKLLIPYFVFDSLFCLFVTVLLRPDDLLETFCGTWLTRVFTLIGRTATWFLPCQFFTITIFAVGAKYLKKPMWIGACVCMFTIAVLFSFERFLPLQRSLVGIGFFAVGFYMKTDITRRCAPVMLCVGGLIYVVLARFNGMVSLIGLRFSNPILYTVNGILGSWLLYQLCLRIPVGRCTTWIEYLGRNSLIVLCTHMFFIEVIRLLDYKLFDNVLYTLGILEGVVFGMLVVGLLFPVIAVSNRYLRKLYGK